MYAQEMMDEIILKSLKGTYNDIVEYRCSAGEVKTAKALKRVIEFYSTPTQYEKWKDSL